MFQSNGIMKKKLFIASLILLLPLFGCLQPRFNIVENLQSDYDRLESWKISLQHELLNTPDPVRVENTLRAVERRMQYIENEILKRKLTEN